MSHFISHVATLEIPVTNLEESIEFYIEILGVSLEFKGTKNAMLTFKSKGVPTIYLVQTDETQAISFKNTNNGIIHSIIDFYSPKLEEFYHWLVEKDIPVGTLNINPENRYGGFGFMDPDGNLLGVTNVLHSGQ